MRIRYAVPAAALLLAGCSAGTDVETLLRAPDVYKRQSSDAMAPSKLWAMGVKLFSQVVVILSNYVFSKLFTFKKK